MRIKLLEKHRKITLVFPIQIKINNISIKKTWNGNDSLWKKEMLWLYYIKNEYLKVMKLQESIPLPLL